MPNRIEGTRAKARSHTHVLCFDDDGPDTSPHPISQEELRAAFNPSDGMECRHHRTGPHSDDYHDD